MTRRSDAYEAGYDPTPEELAEDMAREPSRTYRRPRLSAERPSEPWRDALAVAFGDWRPGGAS